MSAAGTARSKGGKAALNFTKGEIGDGFRALGVLYGRAKDEAIEFVVYYAEHTQQALRDEVAARFGVAAKEWKVREP